MNSTEVNQDSLLEMQAKALEMSGYYLKGMTSAISSISMSAQMYIQSPYAPRVIDEYKTLSRIENFYKNLNFDGLSREVYGTFFVVRRLLSAFRTLMDKIFMENKEEYYDNLVGTSIAIRVVGDVYRHDLENLIETIREYPETSDFNVQVKDFNGVIWTFSGRGKWEGKIK